jgi:hypothetical protein
MKFLSGIIVWATLLLGAVNTQAQDVSVDAGSDQALAYATTPAASVSGSVTAEGIDYTLLWSSSAGVTFGTPATEASTVSFPGPGIYTLTLTAFNSEDDTELDSDELIISVSPFQTHPTNATVLEGTPVQFSVTLGGTSSPTISWQWATTQAGPWTAYSAQTPSTTLSIPLPTVAMNGRWIRASANFGGSGILYSNSAQLTVTASTAPDITTPPGNQTAQIGDPVSFQVTATGSAPLSYSWTRLNSAAGSAWTKVGGNTATYSLAAVQSTDNGAQFRVEVSNGAGAITSTPATLTVITPPSIVTNPQNASVTEPASASFTATVAGTPPLTYQWQSRTPALNTWQAIEAKRIPTHRRGPPPNGR